VEDGQEAHEGSSSTFAPGETQKSVSDGEGHWHRGGIWGARDTSRRHNRGGRQIQVYGNGRREVQRDRDFAMAEGVRQARMLAMARHSSVDESDEERDVQRAENISDSESEMNEPQQVGRERRSSTPVSVAHRNVPTQNNEDVHILKLLQTSASAIYLQASRVSELDERKLRLEEARIEREGEIETRRIKVEEDREARLQRNEDRQAQMEELLIASQKAQTEMMLKMLEIVQNKLP
jgi:hypothetical protein